MNHQIRVTAVVPVKNEDKVRALIETCALAALEYENAPMDAFIDVTITDSEEIREINREYRDKDTATDVLSFPMYEFYNGEPQENLTGEEDPETGKLMLGDMVLNYERACEQAEEYGHTAERECGFLTVHSVMHLLGYDHDRSEAEMKIQRAHEEVVLESLGLAR